MKFLLIFITCFTLLFSLDAQMSESKMMDHNVWDEWNTISNEQLSPDGQWLSYTVSTHDGDPTTYLYNTSSGQVKSFIRVEKGYLSPQQNAFVFAIKPPADHVKELERKKTKKSDMPKDTLCVYSIADDSFIKKANLKSFKVPEEGGNTMVYQVLDTTNKKKPKGYDLIIHHLDTHLEDTLPHISKYSYSESGNQLAAIQVKKDSSFTDAVWLYDTDSRATTKIFDQTGKYSNLSWHQDGTKLAFIADLDTTKSKIRPLQLMYWTQGNATAQEVMGIAHAQMPNNHQVSKNYQPQFSKDGSQLLFGLAIEPKLQDTTLLEDEIVQVEVWSYDDDLLYTQQEARLDRAKNKTYRALYNTEDGSIQILHNQEIPDIILPSDEVNRYKYAIGANPVPYEKLIAWEGTNYHDLYLIDATTGTATLIEKAVDGRARLSPDQQYVYWYQENDTAWYAYSIQQDKINQLTNNALGIFYDEINDRPMHPNSYRSAGWTTNDQYLILYDRYDIWKIDPTLQSEPVKLTDGRKDRIEYRYVRLDPEQQSISLESPWLCSIFDEKDKSAGYVQLDPQALSVKELIKSPHRFRNFQKAKESDQVIFTREDFRTFPDIHLSNLSFQNHNQVSHANPQQDEYRWGTSELYYWVSSDGIDLEGMLIKPDDFDPSKKYPLLVNFYEKSSDRLHSYPTMSPGRSSINYAYYVNQGYVIFNPNIPYKIGWPGESAYNAVISGITALIQEGFIDKERIGVQGHSWGGYQIAHLITRSNIFKCAEAGAPVVNMFSAYGGIRWGSGMSRMFQYEHTQSRIGGTIWDKTIRYFNNSPLFFTDKIETPVLILHNDDDTAVPWYQGIEFFVSLRRLNKPAWLLNYNGEPHGITKWQNRVDFQRRMSQFFDYYLLDKPMPQWMSQGIPAIEKSITTGFETETEADRNK